MYKINTHKTKEGYNDQIYFHACIFFKVPFDAKKYFFCHSSVPFANFSFATLLQM